MRAPSSVATSRIESTTAGQKKLGSGSITPITGWLLRSARPVGSGSSLISSGVDSVAVCSAGEGIGVGLSLRVAEPDSDMAPPRIRFSSPAWARMVRSRRTVISVVLSNSANSETVTTLCRVSRLRIMS